MYIVIYMYIHTARPARTQALSNAPTPPPLYLVNGAEEVATIGIKINKRKIHRIYLHHL